MARLVATRSNTAGKIRKKYIHMGSGFMAGWLLTMPTDSSSVPDTLV
jgi:hypothetical protein